MSPSDPGAGAVSLLERLLLDAERVGLMRINFEDLTGVSADVPDLRLPALFHWHDCGFCRLAKSDAEGFDACRLNKRAVNRRVLRSGRGLEGVCHLGLTDLVEPLVCQGLVLGVFYYGSVVVEGTQARAEAKVHRYHARRRTNPAAMLTVLGQTPVVRPEDLPAYRERLRLVTEVASRLVELSGVPLERYRAAPAEWLMEADRDVPAIVHAAVAHVRRHLAEPLTLSGVASALGCHPDYLGRTFKASLGVSFGEHLHRVRIDRARHLLASGRYSVGEVALRVGYQTQSHFTRVFGELAGMTPATFAAARRSTPA